MIILAIMIGLLVLGIKIARDQETYGKNLEQYINDHNPQNAADIERLTAEFNQSMVRKDVHL